MSTSLIVEVKQQWATLELGWGMPQCTTCVCDGLLWLGLVDQNPFKPCLCKFFMPFSLSFLDISNILLKMEQVRSSTLKIGLTTLQITLFTL